MIYHSDREDAGTVSGELVIVGNEDEEVTLQLVVILSGGLSPENYTHPSMVFHHRLSEVQIQERDASLVLIGWGLGAGVLFQEYVYERTVELLTYPDCFRICIV